MNLIQCALFAVSSAVAVPAALAQSPIHGSAALSPLHPDAAAAAPASILASQPSAAKNDKPLTARWLDLSKMTASYRYRNAFNQGGGLVNVPAKVGNNPPGTYFEGGGTIFNDGQQQMMLVTRFKLDSQERYTINLRASSGGYFNWSYADTAGKGFAERQHQGLIKYSFTNAEVLERSYAGKSDPAGLHILSTVVPTGWHFYARELYLSASPIQQLTLEYGSLGLERGYSSEITSWDDDGWVSGERLRVKDPKHLWLDEAGFTYAYFGRIYQPNFFARGEDLFQGNYRQIFGKKEIDRFVGVSADWTSMTGTRTMREAVSLNTRDWKFADHVTAEFYQRLTDFTFPGTTYTTTTVTQTKKGPVTTTTTTVIAPLVAPAASGFAVTGERRLTDRLSGTLGFANVDTDYSVYTNHRVQHAVGMSMNGDSYGQGERPFLRASYKVNPAVTAYGFYTHALYNARAVTLNQQNFNAGLTFDLKAVVNAGKRNVF